MVYGMCNLAPTIPFAVIRRAARKCPRAMMPIADLQDSPVVTKLDPSRRFPGAMASQSQYATTEGRQRCCSARIIGYTHSSSCSMFALKLPSARGLRCSRGQDRSEGLQTQVATKYRFSSTEMAVSSLRCPLLLDRELRGHAGLLARDRHCRSDLVEMLVLQLLQKARDMAILYHAMTAIMLYFVESR
jgi:hypothetical protein